MFVIIHVGTQARRILNTRELSCSLYRNFMHLETMNMDSWGLLTPTLLWTRRSQYRTRGPLCWVTSRNSYTYKTCTAESIERYNSERTRGLLVVVVVTLTSQGSSLKRLVIQLLFSHLSFLPKHSPSFFFFFHLLLIIPGVFTGEKKK